MADKNPVVMITLDKPRMLWFGHKAMKHWTAITGKSVTDLNTEELGPGEVEELLYCMLLTDAKTNGETLELDQMEDLLDKAPLGVVYQKLSEAMEAAFPEADGKNAARAAAGIGTSA